MQIAKQGLPIFDVVMARLSGGDGARLRRLGRGFPRLCGEDQLADVTAGQAQ